MQWVAARTGTTWLSRRNVAGVDGGGGRDESFRYWGGTGSVPALMPAMRGSGIVLVMNRTVRMLMAAAALAVAVTGLAAYQGAGSIDKAGAASIAKALTSPYAWQRLKRSAAVIGYQTQSEAAEHLGIKQPTLVTQISRLERDIGGLLLERAERRRPMSLTPLGEQVVAALHFASPGDSQVQE